MVILNASATSNLYSCGLMFDVSYILHNYKIGRDYFINSYSIEIS